MGAINFFSLVFVQDLVNLSLLLGCQPNYRLQQSVTLVGAVDFFSLVFVQDFSELITFYRTVGFLASSSLS